MRKRKVALIIEENNTLRIVLRMALEEKGVEVIEVSSEKEAWEKLDTLGKNHRIDYILRNSSSSLYLSDLFLESFSSKCHAHFARVPLLMDLNSLTSDGVLNLKTFYSSLTQTAC